ncbi:hypothetical protein [Arachidicoccus terrestris]|uniref:hypothetical protein n=1 Tax=Arachidicoccus terrestris TaxID=2875539 RepID=UPI001CC5742E|nr:hypothetical protein [Arachidicoccus terrestris]UAY55471.1 hypothetical protein K9M52_00065 [Arachidicoccus terrestris]
MYGILLEKKLTLDLIHFQKNKAGYRAMKTEPSLIMLFLGRDGAGFNAPERTLPTEKD